MARLLVLSTVVISTLYTTTATASGWNPHNSPLLLAQQSMITREEAIAIAKQGQESKVLKVVKQEQPSGSVYRVKLVTKQGRVKQVTVNATTGQIEHQ